MTFAASNNKPQAFVALFLATALLGLAPAWAATYTVTETKADGTTGYSVCNQNNANLANQNPHLAVSLADNGGPTQTLALNTGSFASKAIPYSAGTNTWNNSPMSGGNYYDQRGTEHPAGAAIRSGATLAYCIICMAI